MVCCRAAVITLTTVLLGLGTGRLGCEAKDSIVQQSFDEAVQQCAEMLSICPSKLGSVRSGLLLADADTKCLVRCVGVIGRFWSDQTGLRKDILARYFTTDCADRQNVNRTQTCLDGLVRCPTTPNDCCDRAFESFRCFYHNYGNLHRSRVFVPLDNLQLLHVTARCLEVHRIGVEDLMSLTVTELDGNPNVHCLVRCIGIQTGVYTDRYGVNVDLHYAQYGEGHNEQQYRAEACECLQKQNGTGCSPCQRAYNMLYKCFENVRNVITEYELPDSDEC